MTSFSHLSTGGGELSEKTDKTTLPIQKGFLLSGNGTKSFVVKAGTVITRAMVRPVMGHIPAAGTVTVGKTTTTPTHYLAATPINVFSMAATAAVEQVLVDTRITITVAGWTAGRVHVSLEVIEPEALQQ
jgi:hypothetical protein